MTYRHYIEFLTALLYFMTYAVQQRITLLNKSCNECLLTVCLIIRASAFFLVTGAVTLTMIFALIRFVSINFAFNTIFFVSSYFSQWSENVRILRLPSHSPFIVDRCYSVLATSYHEFQCVSKMLVENAVRHEVTSKGYEFEYIYKHA